MPKQTKSYQLSSALRALVVVLSIAVVVGGASVVHADKYDDQINALSAQNAAAAGVLNGLESQAGSYQAVISQLQQQIDSVQAQIAANQAQQAQLQQQITQDQQEIDQKKSSLGDDIKTMYIDGQMTTIEELASSKNLSDYVDKEEYRTTVQNQLNDKIKEIAGLQAQLQGKKRQVDELVASEQSQNNQLSSDQNQQNQLLAYNQGQQDAYNSQIANNSSQIASLRKQQLAANARFIGGSSYAAGSGPTCGGGYPSVWCNAPQDSIIDTWGMYNRECVSYTAFKVAQSGRYMPYWGGRGNANQWPGDAQAAGIPMSYGSGARPGDVAISTAGAFGHAMYVESVSGNTVNVSQYNAALDGRYSTRSGLSEAGLYFIHF
ncbi:MAG TPA: CHAP domain-containing protein [Candidatus Saccharimonadales bacterium]|nr:CHAP domain-containing protein [Candidatus Saccharimonadales bacterium]